MTTPGLHCDQLSRQVGDRLLLDRLSLSVAPGESLALLGPSGCGKTTTLRLLAGLDPASAGRIVLDGEDVTQRPAGQRQVAMVFQSYALYPHLSVLGNLELGLEVRGVAPAERRQRIAVLNGGVLQQVGTPQELYHRPANLFVARFLGRPGINLLAADGGVQLGIRPEHLRLVESGGLPARLLRREWQGAQQLLWLDTSRGDLLVLAEAALQPAETLQVSWRPQDELRFSSSSGERLD